MYILGISAFYHDAAAALVKDGEIVAAAQEERFTRKKHDPSMPYHAMKYCLEEGQITSEQLSAIVYYDNPILTLDRFAKIYSMREKTPGIWSYYHMSLFSGIKYGCTDILKTLWAELT